MGSSLRLRSVSKGTTKAIPPRSRVGGSFVLDPKAGEWLPVPLPAEPAIPTPAPIEVTTDAADVQQDHPGES